MGDGGDTYVLEIVEELVRRAEFEPGRVLEGVESVLAAVISPAVASVAWRARSKAARVLDQVDDAVAFARRSVALARLADDAGREADARVTLALALFDRGRTRLAFGELDRADHLATDASSLQVLGQRALLLERLGRLDEAIALYDVALRHPSVGLFEPIVLTNRGIALVLRGRYAEALVDLERVRRLEEAEGPNVGLAHTVHNLAFAHASSGDIPRALALFDESDAMLQKLGYFTGRSVVARARALLAARLFDEAATAADGAIAAFAGQRAHADVAEARLLAAQANLRRSAPVAREQARAAATALRRQGRPALAALADHVAVQAQVLEGTWTRRTLAVAERCVDVLALAGLAGEALEARLTAGLLARDLGEPERARVHLAGVSAHRTGGLAGERLRGWHAEALLRLDRGERGSARRAIAAGIEVVREMQGLLGAADLQAAAAGSGVALADLGLQLALEADDAWEVLRWIERWRAGSLALGVPTDVDDDLAEELDALRAALARVTDAERRGEDTSAMRRHVVQAEARIRGRSRHAVGTSLTGPARADLVGQLGRTVLVTYFELRGHVGAVTVIDGTARLHADLGIDLDEVARVGEAVFFALRRLGSPGRSALAQQAGRDALELAIGRLEERLVTPLVAELGEPDRPVLICPTGALLAVPWGGFEALRHRAVGVVPSLAARADDGRGDGPVVLAAGPDLPGAVEEIARLAAVYPDAARFDADRSHTADVLGALEGASVAHFACHGTVRADNPMFSSLRLADGPLTVYDLERLRRAPEVVVLAACDVGASAVRAGGELLGLVSALMRAGTEAVVASVVPVPDAASVGFMTELHTALRGGAPVADALRRARMSLDLADPLALALSAAFICFGSARPSPVRPASVQPAPGVSAESSASRLAHR